MIDFVNWILKTSHIILENDWLVIALQYLKSANEKLGTLDCFTELLFFLTFIFKKEK